MFRGSQWLADQVADSKILWSATIFHWASFNLYKSPAVGAIIQQLKDIKVLFYSAITLVDKR